jgi:hypothetical protein
MRGGGILIECRADLTLGVAPQKHKYSPDAEQI